MDIVPVVASAQQYLQTHPLQDSAAALVLGAIATHPGQCAKLCFSGLMKTPFSGLVLKYEPTISKWFDDFQAEFDRQVQAKVAIKEVAAATPPIVENQPPKV